jgi:hypothetical protein
MKPIEAFQYLFDHNLPLIISFPFEEEKGHVITGKGICHIEKIHGSKATLGRFNPHRLVYHLKKSRSFSINLEIKGETYFCVIEELTASRSTIGIDIPTSLNRSFRRFLRVEPSLRSPVTLYIYTPQDGTVSFTVQDITEQGLSFVAGAPLAIEDNFICGLQIPLDSGTFIFSSATLVYKIEFDRPEKRAKRLNIVNKGVLYGLALFPHSEDVKKIRLYIINRDLEIKKNIQEGVEGKKKRVSL